MSYLILYEIVPSIFVHNICRVYLVPCISHSYDLLFVELFAERDNLNTLKYLMCGS